MEAGRNSDKDELEGFLKAFVHSKLISSSWVTSKDFGYPAHGIRRHLAVAFAYRGENEKGLSVLGYLRELNDPHQGGEMLRLIQIVGQIETVAILARSQPSLLIKLCSPRTKNGYDLMGQIKVLRNRILQFPELLNYVDDLNTSVGNITESQVGGSKQLFSLVRAVGH